MTASDEVGQVSLRKEILDQIIKKFAEPSYKFKQVLSISTTNAWKNDYIRENTAVLDDVAGNDSKGIPRGANFPQLVAEWETIPSWLEKYGAEENIAWEDIITDNVHVQDRSLWKLAQKITSKVDAEVWDVITESQSPTNINSFTIAEGLHWSGSSAAVIDDLMYAKQKIGEANLPTNNLVCFLNERDHRSVVKFVTDSGTQFDKLGDETARNGRVQGLAGMKFIVSNNVTASFAMVVIPKIIGTWQQAVPLSTDVKEDAFKSTRIRVVEMGVTQLHTPLAGCLIMNTRGTQ